ncbi:ChbG/HpnK family deacetylase [Allorhizobium undicola]|uniref:ChbG/HpnK family deacetylase n=1 Tax=Allorhizobium undicola TaxID=78527 RepID=UPI001378FD55|nr:ChbG/HpnK family deacetylase [Allorhizobium undicola]
MMDIRANRKPLHIIADGYGLSPGVDAAIRALLEQGKVRGTGCMTVFSDWREEAELLMPVINDCNGEVGLHLTLTSYMPLSGVKPMCSLKRRISQWLLGSVDKGKLQRELDAQLNAFIDGVGRVPDYIDGYQHVHFLPVVRDWLKARRELLISPRGKSPWLRGEPQQGLALGLPQRGKIAVVERMAAGFNDEMREAGYQVKGPLVGFYPKRNPQRFRDTLQLVRRNAPDDAIMMCRPGIVDQILVSRERQVGTREVEFAELMRQ